MNCDDVKNGIYVFLDGEFADPEAGAFQRHIDGCTRCRTLVAQEAGFLEQVRESLAAPAMPEGLRSRIERALVEEPPQEDRGAPPPSDPPHAWWTRRWMWATPAAVAATVLAFWSLPADEASAGDGEFLREIVAVHTHEFPMEVRGSEEQVRRFLQDVVPFAVNIPFAGHEQIELVGARLTQIGRHPAVLFRYEHAGRPLTVLQSSEQVMRAAAASPGVKHLEGYGVVSYDDRGVNNTVVGNVPEQDLLRLVPVSYAP